MVDFDPNKDLNAPTPFVPKSGLTTPPEFSINIYEEEILCIAVFSNLNIAIKKTFSCKLLNYIISMYDLIKASRYKLECSFCRENVSQAFVWLSFYKILMALTTKRIDGTHNKTNWHLVSWSTYRAIVLTFKIIFHSRLEHGSKTNFFIHNLKKKYLQFS